VDFVTVTAEKIDALPGTVQTHDEIELTANQGVWPGCETKVDRLASARPTQSWIHHTQNSKSPAVDSVAGLFWVD